jgi:hypothetical protein
MDSTAAGAGGAGLHVSFRTMCGREIRVGHLALGGGRHPARRVSLDIGAAADGGDGTWTGLTAGEARRLAAALLTHAAVCDTRPPQTLGSSRPAASAERSHLRTCPAVQGQVHRFSSGTPAMT